MAKNRFCGYELAKPFVLPLRIVALPKTIHFFDFYEKKTSENETAFAIGGRLTTILLHALCVCVFLCIPLFDCKMRTLKKYLLLGNKRMHKRRWVRGVTVRGGVQLTEKKNVILS